MNANKHPASGYFDSIWKLFASVKLTVILLLTMAGTSIIGTLIPQNEAPQQYLQSFGPFLFRIFHVLDLFDMYHAWWFQFFMLVLMINIIVCSVDRLSITWKIIFNKTPAFNPARFSALPKAQTFDAGISPDTMKEKAFAMLGKQFSYTRVETLASGYAVYAEKGRWTRLGVYAVHLSVVLLVLGSLIGSLFGYEGAVNIPEGESVRAIRLRNSERMILLPFDIRCDDFNLTLYNSGRPREYRSSLTLLNDGKPLVQKDIIMNDPLRYNGINIFQNSYGQFSPSRKSEPKAIPIGPDDEITLSFTSTASGMTYERKTRLGQSVAIPEGLGTFTPESYLSAAKFGDQDIGSAVTGELEPANGASVDLMLPLNFPRFDKMRKGAVVIAVTGYPHEHFSPESEKEKRYYTGLQVTYDPGIWVVYAGFIMIIVGCYITFFTSHQQVCVLLDKTGGKISVTVSGTANKNKPAVWHKVEQLAERLATAVGAQHRPHSQKQD